MTVDQTFELSWYEIYLLFERVKKENERRGVDQELESVRLSHSIANIRNAFGGKGGGVAFKAEDFYIPSWQKEKKVEEARTDEEIISKFPKKLKDG